MRSIADQFTARLLLLASNAVAVLALIAGRGYADDIPRAGKRAICIRSATAIWTAAAAT
jgi:hypothetical protein